MKKSNAKKPCSECVHFIPGVPSINDMKDQFGKDSVACCKIHVRHFDKVNGKHRFFPCEMVRGRKPSWTGKMEWCGAAGKLFKEGNSFQSRIAEYLIENAGFSEADAHACAKEIIELQ